MKRQVFYCEITGRHPYKDVWALQDHLLKDVVKNKRQEASFNPNYLLLCEHSPVYTLGKSGKESHLLLDKETIESGIFDYHKINRGGDITYHGPGQITGYPIFDLDQFYRDLHRYIREIEEVIIRTLKDLGIQGQRLTDYTGVWVGDDVDDMRKICAIGVHMSRWVSMHGFALNVNTNLSHFDHIIPCGIQDENKTVTSISKETGLDISLHNVMQLLKLHFKEVFDVHYF